MLHLLLFVGGTWTPACPVEQSAAKKNPQCCQFSDLLLLKKMLSDCWQQLPVPCPCSTAPFSSQNDADWLQTFFVVVYFNTSLQELWLYFCSLTIFSFQNDPLITFHYYYYNKKKMLQSPSVSCSVHHNWIFPARRGLFEQTQLERGNILSCIAATVWKG